MIRIHKNWREHLWLWFAVRLPKRLKYWVVIQVGSAASTGMFANTPASEITLFDVIRSMQMEKEDGH